MPYFFSFFLLVFAGFFPCTAAALEKNIWNAQVIKVADGDTLTVHILSGDFREAKQRIRLYGIDCPEKNQSNGDTATDLTTMHTIKKEIILKGIDIDRYERIVGIVFSSDGSILQEELLQSGLAWVYPQYCKLAICTKWLKLQKEAQEHKLGIWREKDPVPPWEWRKIQKQK